MFEVYPQVHGEGEQEGQPTGEFGWRYRSANGQITAASGEGFTRREDAERAVRDFTGEIIAKQGETGHEVKHVEADGSEVGAAG